MEKKSLVEITRELTVAVLENKRALDEEVSDIYAKLFKTVLASYEAEAKLREKLGEPTGGMPEIEDPEDDELDGMEDSMGDDKEETTT